MGICAGTEGVWEANVVGMSSNASSFLPPFSLLWAKGYASLSMTCMSKNIRDAYFIQEAAKGSFSAGFPAQSLLSSASAAGRPQEQALQ